MTGPPAQRAGRDTGDGRGYHRAMDSTAPALLAAMAFAAHKHRDQRRKDEVASPYINHPIALAYLLACTGGVDDLVVLQAAILHDTVEDTQTTAAELVEHFGERVAAVVAEVTDDKSLPSARRKELQVEHAPQMSREAALVKLADKTCNLRDMTSAPPANWSIERRRDYFDWARRVVDGLQPVNDAMRAAFDNAFSTRP